MAAVTAWRWLRGHQATIGFLVLAAGNIAGWRALEAERHDRCVASRMDVQAAFVAVAEDLNADDETRDTVAATVARVLPVGEC